MLLTKVERFLRQTHTPATRFGSEAVNDPRFVFDLRRGREPRSATVRRVLAHLDACRANAIDVPPPGRTRPPDQHHCGVCRYAELACTAHCRLVDHG